MVYVKYVLESIPMSTWTRVYYNNAIALAMWPPFLLVGAEYSRLPDALASLQQSHVLPYVLTSCLVGIGISFTGFGFRNLVTATTFTVVGVMNKVLTIFVSITFLAGANPSPLGLTALLACIGGGTLYRQAPPRKAGSDSSNG